MKIVTSALVSFRGRRFGDDLSLLRDFIESNTQAPAGNYVLGQTLELGENEVLDLAEGAVIQVRHTGVGVLLKGSGSSLRGGKVSGLQVIPFTETAGGLWESRVANWSGPIKARYPTEWIADMLVKNGTEWVYPCEFPGDGKRIKGTHPSENWSNTVTVTAAEIPQWNLGTTHERVVKHWESFGGYLNAPGGFWPTADDLLGGQARPWVIRHNIASLSPGTYCYDRAHQRILYMPDGESLEETVFAVPLPAMVVEIAGTAEAPLENVSIHNCDIVGSSGVWRIFGTPLESGLDSTGPQRSALRVSYASADIRYARIGLCAYVGVTFWKKSDGSVMRNSSVDTTGMNCVLVGNWVDAANMVDGILIEECRIRKGSQAVWAAIGVGLRLCRNVTIRNCRIGDCRSKILGIPGFYGETGYLIEDNELYGGVTTVSDTGIFTTAWTLENSIFRNNYLHSHGHPMPSISHYATCFMQDANSVGWLVENNLFVANPLANWPCKVNLPGRTVHRNNKFHAPSALALSNNGSYRFMYPGVTDRKTALAVGDNGNGTAFITVATDNVNRVSGSVAQNWTVVSKSVVDGNKFLEMTSGVSLNTNWTALANATIAIAQTGANPGHFGMVRQWIDQPSSELLRMDWISDAVFDAIQVGDVYKMMLPGSSSWFVRILDGEGADRAFRMNSYTVLNKDQLRFNLTLSGYLTGDTSVADIAPGDVVQLLLYHVTGEQKLDEEELADAVQAWLEAHPEPVVVEPPEEIPPPVPANAVYFQGEPQKFQGEYVTSSTIV